MGRQARLLIPDLPHHIVQRGHDKNAVFAEESDYRFYLDNLMHWKQHYAVGVYAYCLMTNHVHLVLVPEGRDGDISGLMRRISARHCRRMNKLNCRTGTLLDGRFKSSVIDTDRYLLACLRYVELNPIRAGMVNRPEHYRWSSYRQRLGLTSSSWLDADPVTRQLGTTVSQIRRSYAAFVEKGNSHDELEVFRDAVRRNQLTGNANFIKEIEDRVGRRIDNRGPGRPKNRPGTFSRKK